MSENRTSCFRRFRKLSGSQTSPAFRHYLKSGHKRPDFKHSVHSPYTCPALRHYSGCPKSGRPDFGVFKNHPVPKTSGFQTFCLKSGQKRLITGRLPDINPYVMSGIQTFAISDVSENRTQLCPVFGHLLYKYNGIKFSVPACGVKKS